MLIIKKINNKIIIKRVFALTVLSVFLAGTSYFIFSPAIIMAYSSTGTATPTLVVTGELNVTSPGVITLSNSIPGMTGNYGNPASGTAIFTVVTSNVAGFTMTLSAGTDSDVLATGAYYFSDYTATATPDYTWTSPDVGSGTFGFALGASGTQGADAAQAFKNNGGACNISGGTNSASYCWRGFQNSFSTPVPVINRGTATPDGGIEETVVFQAEYRGGTGYYLTSGTYTATITATAATQ